MIFQVLILLVIGLVYLAPMARIFQRAGWNPWTVLLLLVPLVNIAMLWIFAYGAWPALKDQAEAFS